MLEKAETIKISLLSSVLKKYNADYLFITAPENVAWLLNIRGSDNPFSPIPNCNCLIGKNKEIFLIAQKKKLKNLLKKENTYASNNKS